MISRLSTDAHNWTIAIIILLYLREFPAAGMSGTIFLVIYFIFLVVLVTYAFLEYCCLPAVPFSVPVI